MEERDDRQGAYRGKSGENAEEIAPELEADQAPEETFEEGSMFNPGQGNDDFQYEEMEGNTGESGSNIGGVPDKLGDAELYKQSNENAYNIRHATQKKFGRLPPVPLLGVYKAMAERLTEQRREHFRQVQKE